MVETGRIDKEEYYANHMPQRVEEPRSRWHRFGSSVLEEGKSIAKASGNMFIRLFLQKKELTPAEKLMAKLEAQERFEKSTKDEWRKLTAEGGELIISLIPVSGPPIGATFNQLVTGEFDIDKTLKGIAAGAADWTLLGIVNKIRNIGKSATVAQKAAKLIKERRVLQKAKLKPKWSRAPKSVQDKLALEKAKTHPVHLEPKKLPNEYLKQVYKPGQMKNPRYENMEKWEYVLKSKGGKKSVIHYVRDPKTGRLMDFKFKTHAVDW